MSMLIKNLEYLMYKKRISANQLQELTGVAQSTTTRILNGDTVNPRDDVLQKYADYFGYTVAQLRYDDIENGVKVSDVVDVDNVVVGKIETDIQIPIYAAYFCCGDGNDADFEELKGYRGFSSDFFKTRNIKPDNFVLVCAANDSMSPHIEHKDEVGIDISDKEIKDGEVYAILLDGAKMFKQVFVEAGGNLRLHSFNPNYPDKLITPQNHNSLIVVGRKVYRAG
ncbi:S24 family peptidase [Campylobacter jejuni]